MKDRRRYRILAVLLTLAMTFGMMPVSTEAAINIQTTTKGCAVSISTDKLPDGITYNPNLVTVDGKKDYFYLLVSDGYVPPTSTEVHDHFTKKNTDYTLIIPTVESNLIAINFEYFTALKSVDLGELFSGLNLSKIQATNGTTKYASVSDALSGSTSGTITATGSGLTAVTSGVLSSGVTLKTSTAEIKASGDAKLNMTSSGDITIILGKAIVKGASTVSATVSDKTASISVPSGKSYTIDINAKTVSGLAANDTVTVDGITYTSGVASSSFSLDTANITLTNEGDSVSIPAAKAATVSVGESGKSISIPDTNTGSISIEKGASGLVIKNATVGDTFTVDGKTYTVKNAEKEFTVNEETGKVSGAEEELADGASLEGASGKTITNPADSGNDTITVEKDTPAAGSDTITIPANGRVQIGDEEFTAGASGAVIVASASQNQLSSGSALLDENEKIEISADKSESGTYTVENPGSTSVEVASDETGASSIALTKGQSIKVEEAKISNESGQTNVAVAADGIITIGDNDKTKISVSGEAIDSGIEIRCGEGRSSVEVTKAGDEVTIGGTTYTTSADNTELTVADNGTVSLASGGVSFGKDGSVVGASGQTIGNTSSGDAKVKVEVVNGNSDTVTVDANGKVNIGSTEYDTITGMNLTVDSSGSVSLGRGYVVLDRDESVIGKTGTLIKNTSDSETKNSEVTVQAEDYGGDYVDSIDVSSGSKVTIGSGKDAIEYEAADKSAYIYIDKAGKASLQSGTIKLDDGEGITSASGRLIENVSSAAITLNANTLKDTVSTDVAGSRVKIGDTEYTFHAADSELAITRDSISLEKGSVELDQNKSISVGGTSVKNNTSSADVDAITVEKSANGCDIEIPQGASAEIGSGHIVSAVDGVAKVTVGSDGSMTITNTSGSLTVDGVIYKGTAPNGVEVSVSNTGIATATKGDITVPDSALTTSFSLNLNAGQSATIGKYVYTAGDEGNVKITGRGTDKTPAIALESVDGTVTVALKDATSASTTYTAVNANTKFAMSKGDTDTKNIELLDNGNADNSAVKVPDGVVVNGGNNTVTSAADNTEVGLDSSKNAELLSGKCTASGAATINVKIPDSTGTKTVGVAIPAGKTYTLDTAGKTVSGLSSGDTVAVNDITFTSGVVDGSFNLDAEAAKLSNANDKASVAVGKNAKVQLGDDASAPTVVVLNTNTGKTDITKSAESSTVELGKSGDSFTLGEEKYTAGADGTVFTVDADGSASLTSGCASYTIASEVTKAIGSGENAFEYTAGTNGATITVDLEGKVSCTDGSAKVEIKSGKSLQIGSHNISSLSGDAIVDFSSDGSMTITNTSGSLTVDGVTYTGENGVEVSVSNTGTATATKGDITVPESALTEGFSLGLNPSQSVTIGNYVYTAPAGGNAGDVKIAGRGTDKTPAIELKNADGTVTVSLASNGEISTVYTAVNANTKFAMSASDTDTKSIELLDNGDTTNNSAFKVPSGVVVKGGSNVVTSAADDTQVGLDSSGNAEFLSGKCTVSGAATINVTIPDGAGKETVSVTIPAGKTYTLDTEAKTVSGLAEGDSVTVDDITFTSGAADGSFDLDVKDAKLNNTGDKVSIKESTGAEIQLDGSDPEPTVVVPNANTGKTAITKGATSAAVKLEKSGDSFTIGGNTYTAGADGTVFTFNADGSVSLTSGCASYAIGSGATKTIGSGENVLEYTAGTDGAVITVDPEGNVSLVSGSLDLEAGKSVTIGNYVYTAPAGNVEITSRGTDKTPEITLKNADGTVKVSLKDDADTSTKYTAEKANTSFAMGAGNANTKSIELLNDQGTITIPDGGKVKVGNTEVTAKGGSANVELGADQTLNVTAATGSVKIGNKTYKADAEKGLDVSVDGTGTATVTAGSEVKSSSGGGSGSSAASSGSVVNTTETKTDASGKGSQTTTVPETKATVAAETKTAEDGTKTTTAKVDTTVATQIVEMAVENKSEEVIIAATETPAVETAAGTTTEVAIPAETVSQIAEKTDAAVTIESEAAKVTLDQKAVAAVAEAAGETGTVSLVVETKAQNENKAEVELKLETSNGTVSDFKGGSVSVTVKLNSALAGKHLICVYVDDNGNYHKVVGHKNADGTYTFTTSHFSTYAIVPEEEANAVIAAQITKVKELLNDTTLKARSTKTKKGNIKVTLKANKKNIQAIKDLGYTVTYKFSRSTKASSAYKAKAEKTIRTYTDKTGKKGRKYYYKVRVMVYELDGSLIAKTPLKKCKYASRVK